MSTIFVMESANLFAGDHDPTASKHLTLAELKLPTLQEMYQDHHAGGSRVQIEVAVGIQKLEPTFKLNGWDPDLLSQFGLGSSRQKVFTAYGVIRDKRTGVAIEAKRFGKAYEGIAFGGVNVPILQGALERAQILDHDVFVDIHDRKRTGMGEEALHICGNGLSRIAG